MPDVLLKVYIKQYYMKYTLTSRVFMRYSAQVGKRVIDEAEKIKISWLQRGGSR